MLLDKPWNQESSLEIAGKRQIVYNIIHDLHAINVTHLIAEAKRENIEWHELKGILTDLKKKGLIYNPKSGVIVCVDEKAG